MSEDYGQARKLISKAVSEAQPLMVDPNDDDTYEIGDFEIQKDQASIGRWVLLFETTAPATHRTEDGDKFTFAKGFYCISSDNTDETSLQEWEILGMFAYSAKNELFG